MPKSTAWARPWATAHPRTEPMLRSGAWYPVVHDEPGGLVLEVRHEEVIVPRHLLEVRRERPRRFTVVYRAPSETNPARDTDRDLGRTYAVCPASGHRLPVWRNQPFMECPRCGFRGEVAWGETG